VGVAPRHHGGALGDAQVRLPHPHSVFARQAVQSLDGCMQELGVGQESDGLGLHRCVDGDPFHILGPQRAALVRHPQALGQQKFELVAEPPAPMAQVRTLVREGVLEEFFPGCRFRSIADSHSDALRTAFR
jgi:hypothetical protein